MSYKGGNQEISQDAYALDADRTLIKPDVAVELFDVACKLAGIVDLDLRSIQLKVEQAKKSFSPLTAARNARVKDPQRFDDACRKFIEIGHQRRDELLYEDAEPLLDNLRVRAVPHFILSTATDFEWQMLKFRPTPLIDVPILLLDTHDKGTVVQLWERIDENNRVFYQTPNLGTEQSPFVIKTRNIIGVDDRKRALRHWPNHCTGHWLDRPEERGVHSKKKDFDISVGSNIERIHDLRELIK